MEHLEEFGTRLVNGDKNDLVVRHPTDDFHDVLGILRGEARSWFVEKVNVGHPDHIQPDVEAFAFAAAQYFPLSAADALAAPFGQAKLDEFCVQAAGAIAPREVRRTNRSRKQQIFPDGEMLIESVFLRHVTDVA